MKFSRATELHQEWSLIKKSGTRLFRVDKKFQWWLDYDNKRERVIVEAWFLTDFWSIPRIFWPIFNPTEWISYILHDQLYEDQYVLIGDDQLKRYITREEADQILRSSLIVEWASTWYANMVYLWVRIGWWYRWSHS